jgi:hypothetical protein
MAHLCGRCLTLRDLHGHGARLVTNYDGLLVSVQTQAQSPAGAARREAGAAQREAGAAQREVGAAQREAGPCALRGFRRVADAGEGPLRRGGDRPADRARRA